MKTLIFLNTLLLIFIIQLGTENFILKEYGLIPDIKLEQQDYIIKTLLKRNPHIPEVVLREWAETIQNASDLYHIKTDVFLSLFRIESALVHYDSTGTITLSYKGAGGLGQIMPFWYKDCPHSNTPQDLRNAHVNIMCSAYILRTYLDGVNQDYFLALTAYYSGYRGVRLMRNGNDITNGYAERILSNV